MTRTASPFRPGVRAALAITALAAGVSNAVAQPHITYTTVGVGDFRGGAVGLAVDANGVIYASDISSGGPAVMRYVPAGAGTYTPSTVTNSAVEPAGVAVDASGNLYIVDEQGKVLKETYSNGTYTETTVISSGITNPYGLAIDAAGNLYLTSGNQVLKETLSNGTYTSSVIPTSSLNNPEGVAVDSSGNVYIADYLNSRVLKETYQAGAYTESTIGTGLNNPQAVAVDGVGTVYIGDTNNNRILLELPQAGSYVQSVFPYTSDESTLGLPAALATDTNGSMYYAAVGFVSSYIEKESANELAEAAATSFSATAVAGTAATQVVTFTFDVGGSLGASPPYSVSTQGNATLDFRAAGTQGAGVCVSGRSYAVGDTCTVTVSFSPTKPGPRYGAVVLYASTGAPSATAYLQGGGTSPQVSFSPGMQLNNIAGLDPLYLAADSIGDILYWENGIGIMIQPVAQGRNGAIGPVATAGASGLGVDGAGNVLVSNSNVSFINNGVEEPSFLVEQNIFNPYYLPAVNANPNASGKNYSPGAQYGSGISNGGLAIDGSGNFFFTDPDNNVVFMATFTGGGYDVSSIGSGFSNPTALAVDAGGAVYVADTNNNQIVKETPGNGSYTQSVVITGLTAPTYLAVDSAGALYIPQSTAVLKETLTNGAYVSSVVVPLNNIDALAVDPSGNLFLQNCGSSSCFIDEIDVADAPTLSFATTAIGSTSSDSPQTVTILNNGNAPLTFSAPGSTAPITAGFTISPASTCPVAPGATQSQTLAVGASCTLVVSFVPTTSGYVSGTLTVGDNTLNAPGSTQVIKLNGTGTGTSTSPPATAQVTLTPTTFDYGTVAVGASGSETFTLANTGTVIANIASAAIPAGAFSVASTTCTTSLAAGATCTYVVDFAPTAAGSQSATFTVTDDAGTPTAALTGTGTTSSTAPPPATADFTVTASPSTQTVTGGNTVSYTVSIASASGGTFTQPVALTATGLPAGATVTFSPASVTPGSAGATVTMTVQTTPLSAENSNIAGRSSGDHDLSGDRGSFAYWPVGVPTVAAALFALPTRVRRPVRSGNRARSCGRGISFTRRLGLLLLAGAALSLSGCGGGFALPGTTTTSQPQPQTYTITIAGTSGSLQHSTSVQITLQ
jgi:Abnormal spindle-like microcephaly-assoc'd, ASPM-SPD-2-Hydin/NHL repeat